MKKPGFLCIFLGFLLTLSFSLYPEQFDIIQKNYIGTEKVIYRIDRPYVKQAVTPYKHIWFLPGDIVTIQAGGCVQTGGVGKTWKSYINPLGKKSDRYYSGLILLPGITPGLVRIKGYLNTPYTIPAGIPQDKLYLTLGYEDDDYDDNGYWGHDDGNYDQCKGIGPAYVIVIIEHPQKKETGQAKKTKPVKPLDLVWTSVDYNLVPLNPKWGVQLRYQKNTPGYYPSVSKYCPLKMGLFEVPYQKKCLQSLTSQFITFDRGAICGYHANWGAATYEGKLEWDMHDPNDDDYNIRILRKDHAGATRTSGNIKMEFDSDETIDYFDNVPWWKAFHDAVDADHVIFSEDVRAKSMINGKYGIATGLIGMDCAHDCDSELHPVWALAINVKTDADDDTWAMFVRNWGNEGFCGNKQHYLALPLAPNKPGLYEYTFRIPWMPGATKVKIKSKTFVTNDSRVCGPVLTYAAGEKVLVSFYLPGPLAGARVSGELHLKWTKYTVRSLRIKARSKTETTARKQEKTAESIFRDLVKNLTPQQRAAYDREMKKFKSKKAVPDKLRPKGGGVIKIVKNLPPPKPSSKMKTLRSWSVPDKIKIMQDQRVINAMFKAGVIKNKQLKEPLLNRLMVIMKNKPVMKKIAPPITKKFKKSETEKPEKIKVNEMKPADHLSVDERINAGKPKPYEPIDPHSTMSEDFDRKDIDGWELLKNGAFQDGGLFFNGPGTGFWRAATQYGQNFSLSFQYLHGNGRGTVILRFSGEPPSDQYYRIVIHNNEILFIRKHQDHEKTLHRSPVDLHPGTWHNVRIILIDKEIRVAIDDRELAMATDEEIPLGQGAIGFGCIEGSGFGFDHILLEKPTRK